MKVANWIILVVLLGMLSSTIWIGYDMWIDDLRHSGFGEWLYCGGYWCGAYTIDQLRADRTAILQ